MRILRQSKINFWKLLRWVRFNLSYIGDPPWDTGIPAPELIEFIEKSKPGIGLDLGCGTGTNIFALGEAGWDVDGVEMVNLAVWKARQKLNKLPYPGHIYRANVINLGFLKKEYDLILDIGCFHSLSDHERDLYRKNLKRLLRENGTFLLYSFLKKTSSQIGIDSVDINEFRKLFTLISRKDGLEKEQKPSTWLEFKNLDN
jgi:SAM-dependent methyltransferase